MKRLIILGALVLGACSSSAAANPSNNEVTEVVVTANEIVTTEATEAQDAVTVVAQADEPTVAPIQQPQPAPEEPALPLTARGEQIVALVNGQPITLIEFQRVLDRFEITDIASYDAIAARELDKLIEQTIINQAAEGLGIDVRAEEIEAEYQAMREIMPDDNEWRQWLTNNRFLNESEFRLATLDALTTAQVQIVVLEQVENLTIQQVQARHILVTSQAEAQTAYARLQAGEDFGTVAREMSIDETTRTSGGDLGENGGWIIADDLIVPELATLALRQPDGSYSEPFPTMLGWHIVQTLARSERPAQPEEAASVRAQVFAQWLAEQMSTATIERYVD